MPEDTTARTIGAYAAYMGLPVAEVANQMNAYMMAALDRQVISGSRGPAADFVIVDEVDERAERDRLWQAYLAAPLGSEEEDQALQAYNAAVARIPVVEDEPEDDDGWTDMDDGPCQCDQCTEPCDRCGIRMLYCNCPDEPTSDPSEYGRLTITDTAEDIERWVKSLA